MSANPQSISTTASAPLIPGSDPFLSVLKEYWGYDAFRPGQEAIVRAIASGRDACVIMPTGGGKSLCYQLPAALAANRTAVVVSPLIALMQDQVAQLLLMGIPAAFVNSSLSASEKSQILRRAEHGEFRLLYLSPERLALEDAARWLKQIPISFFAIDEAHCISEWGHDFRPDYRQLSRLRKLFPDRPIAAFTASATKHVRHDIIDQLHLRDPLKHVASFQRHNLRYCIRRCNAVDQEALLLQAIRRAPEGNIIVYAPTIARVGELVEFLEKHNITAVGYHGQMDARERRENQEKWMTDEVRVMVGTLAFGLGINKATVRMVIHLALPKSIEQYYQESGRAGRDGLPAECLLFWQKKDAGLHTYFLSQISDKEERERAWQRYHQVEDFVASSDCRQEHICHHFGETLRSGKCGHCDQCAGTPDWLAETASSTKSSRGSHQAASSYTGSALVSVTRTDSELRSTLREWRRNKARELGVAAFIVMHDSTLDDLCRVEPSSLSELRQVSGFGAKKIEQYGEEILAELRRFRQNQPAPGNWQPSLSPPQEETLQLLNEGRTFLEIAALRGVKPATVAAAVSELIEKRVIEFQRKWMDAGRYAQIEAAIAEHGASRLKPLKDALPEDFTYEEIRLVAATHRRPNTPVSA